MASSIAIDQAAEQGRTWIAALEGDEREASGIPSLKVGFNQVFGYYFEVTRPYFGRVPASYRPLQTLKDRQRYTREDLRERERAVLRAEEAARRREYEVFDELRKDLAGYAQSVREAGQALAELDAYAALAEVAAERHHCRPRFGDAGFLELRAARHPVVERYQNFIPNDAQLDPKACLVVLTGPNMSGKSTYLRQIAVTAMMAQIGSFVAAEEATLPVFEHIYTRIGASDDIAGGRSTFMVEMSELARILHSAGPSSLVLLDEIGRGTSTFDDLALAWAAAEYLHDVSRATTLFAYPLLRVDRPGEPPAGSAQPARGGARGGRRPGLLPSGTTGPGEQGLRPRGGQAGGRSRHRPDARPRRPGRPRSRALGHRRRGAGAPPGPRSEPPDAARGAEAAARVAGRSARRHGGRTGRRMIRKLPPELIREIAAGEVVSGPDDVLRELLENALDAGATRLEIELEAGGRERVAVRDNGHGISGDQLELALESHSTSKLDRRQALQAVRTLGFRGEGLYAIRHAARIALTSRPPDQLGGVCVVAEGATLTRSETPAAAGTSAEVTGLFAALPARRQALGSAATEGKACLAVLTRRLLHHPELQLRLELDGEVRLAHAGGTQEAVKLIWGEVSANRMLPLALARQELRLEGLLSRPELSRARRDRLLLAINGRPVRWPEALQRAVLRGYRELLPTGRYPLAILNLELPPSQLVVSTAPDKARIKLLHPAAVAAFVQEAVEAALAQHPLAPPLPELRAFEGVCDAPRSAFPALHHLGRYRDLYLLAESGGSLWVVDQHAAHERILFEELEARYRSEPPIELAHPELLALAPEEAQRYLERRQAFADIGLTLEPFGADRWRLRTVPAFLAGAPQLIAEAVKGPLSGPARRGLARRAGALACLPAIKAGHPLAQADAQDLSRRAGALPHPLGLSPRSPHRAGALGTRAGAPLRAAGGAGEPESVPSPACRRLAEDGGTDDPQSTKS